MNHWQPRSIAIVCVLLSALAVAGCSESPQEKYNDATSKLQDAKKARQKAKDTVADAKKEVKDAKQELDKAQDKLQEARQKVIAATQAVNKTVNDEVLFRTLQRSVLNKDEFAKSAISVGVNNRVVTLTGTVPDQKTHKKALQVVRDQAGVANVNDQLEVADGQNGAPKPADAGTGNNADKTPKQGSNDTSSNAGQGQSSAQPQADQPQEGQSQ
ncbi:BON domain-containing protein [Salinisphaera sp. SPP-AMP-43]|uniref:BON domain-containing protein n=1 Tax=Salinisphaera sp. SPP-AMP-43 TaxID=3121288 RepID=UPI003C6E835F